MVSQDIKSDLIRIELLICLILISQTIDIRCLASSIATKMCVNTDRLLSDQRFRVSKSIGDIDISPSFSKQLEDDELPLSQGFRTRSIAAAKQGALVWLVAI